ncbi:MAG TPA: cyclic nucleotide-binding domain-containing protein [Ferrovibrio sp.]|uniref:cyclic nucleotide-binding domain-containing protein n=1 Tax=Ferrovibrio sp. TaxID=1917215 RepID=UPI002ED0956F
MTEDAAQDFSFDRGALLLREGDQGDFCYLILSGRVEVFRNTAKGRARLAELGEGGVVGEMALIDPAPRSASVAALEPTQCRRINGAALERALAASPPLVRYMLQTLIRHIRFASGSATTMPSPVLSSGEMMALVQSERSAMRVLDRKVFAAGEVIFRAGQPSYSAYLIQSGRVDLVRQRDDGSEEKLRSVGAGEVLGELSLLTDGVRLATAIAREATACEQIGAAQFKALVNAAPAIVRALIRIYAGIVLRPIS